MWTFQPSAWKLNSFLSTDGEYPLSVIASSFGHITVETSLCSWQRCAEIPNMYQGFGVGVAISENLIYILKTVLNSRLFKFAK